MSKELTPEEKAIVENITNAIESKMLKENEVKDLIANSGLNKKEIEDLKSEHQEQLDTLGIQIKELQEKGEGHKSEDLGEILSKNHKANIEQFEKTNKLSLQIPLKSITNKATILPASFSSNTYGMYLPGFGQAATQRTKLAQLFAQFPMGAGSHRTVYYADQITTTRNAAARTVGNAAAESALAWTAYSKPLESISDSIPFAKEMLSDVDGMEAEIRNFIEKNLMLKEDAYLAVGTGTPPQIKGIYTYAPTFDSASYTGFKPTLGGLMDLIIVMATDIMKATQYNVDVCLINPADILGLTLEKDANGNRINLPMVQMNGEIMVKSIRVIETASIAANTLVLGDFNMARRYYGETLNLEFGYNASGDFTKRIVTLLGNMEELLLVRSVEENAFLKSTDITGDILNITAVGN